MHYNIIFKKVTDISRECPFLPDEEQFEIHLSAIVEDIKTINGVSSVNLLLDGSVSIVTTGITQKFFEEQLKPFLSEHFCYLRHKIKVLSE